MLKYKIIVLIPHYNNLLGLKESIKSIDEELKVDLMIVDDGSTIPPTLDELRKVYHLGEIYLEKLSKNVGIEHALNYGLNKILTLDYKYIARLDVGDFCYKNRFKEQLHYLILNPETKLLGTQVNFIDKKGNVLYQSNLPRSYEKIKRAFYINCVVIHPTIVLKSEILSEIGLYPLNYEAAEDYAFFFKILKKYKIENLDKILLNVVVDENGISTKKRKKQIKSKIKIIKNNYYFGLHPTYGLLRNFLSLFISRKSATTIKRILKKND